MRPGRESAPSSKLALPTRKHRHFVGWILPSHVLRLEYPNKNSRVLGGDQTSTSGPLWGRFREANRKFYIIKKSTLSRFYQCMTAYTYDKDETEILSNASSNVSDALLAPPAKA